ncbi:MAG: hypothetical protein Q9162_000784 [Coniocarpon cinnabarinum]
MRARVPSVLAYLGNSNAKPCIPPPGTLVPRARNRDSRRNASYSSRSTKPMKHTIDRYFEDLVSTKAPAPATHTAPSPPPPEELPKTQKEENLLRARVVFGSRLAGPIERQRERDEHSTLIAGVSVPPRPGEPDNCCMSGCVNCVYDRYREELEEWAEKRAEADRALMNRGQSREAPAHVTHSMDDDGGGSETNWSLSEVSRGKSGDLFEGIPIGIREFMKQEKRLKERKRRRAAQTG